MLFAACTAGANTEPAASAAPVAADAFMKARRFTRTMSLVFTMPSSLSDRTAPASGPCRLTFHPGSESPSCTIRGCRVSSIIERRFALWDSVADSRVSVNCRRTGCASHDAHTRRRQGRQGVHGDARQGPHRPRHVRQGAAGDDALAGGAGDRPVARDRKADPAHARRAWLRDAERAAVLAFVRHSQARLRISRDAELDRAGFAADAAAQRAIP